MQQVTTANTSWDGLEKYWYHTSTENEQLNKPRKRTTGRDCVTTKKRQKKKGTSSHQRPRWWIAKTAAATGNVQDWQERTTAEQLLFWDCKTNNDFYGHGDDGLFAIKANNKQWHYCQEEAEEPVSSQYATKLTCSNNRANRGYRPNHDVAPCRKGSLTTANTVNNGWENEPAAAHRRETHVSLKENRNRTTKRKIISCLTCQSLFHFSRAMFSLDNEPVSVRVFLFANNL